MEGDNSSYQKIINAVQETAVAEKKETRYDQLTFLTAQEYIQTHRPRVAFIGLGETDEYGHDGRYDLYLDKANQADKMIAELWHWVQTTPGYKDNTTFIITTDHGRGSRTNKWTSHGSFIKGSSQTWMGIIGPGITATGEQHTDGQIFQVQLAQTFAHILGEDFSSGNNVAPSISLR
jgi:arylsulfatase A-like enzyme